MIRICALLCAYYVVGIAAIAVINAHKKDAAVRERWIKLGMYLIITGTLILLLSFAPLLAIGVAAGIILTGFYELYRLRCLAGLQRLWIVGLYSVIAALFLSFIMRSRFGPVPCIAYMIVLSFDGFSQIFGQLLGGRKIAPRISPAKTGSGFAGGLLIGIATGAFLYASVSAISLLIALAICLFAFTGDLFASAIKRRAGVKDYSSLIPGHGGVLDRFDSFLFAGAMLEFYFRFL